MGVLELPGLCEMEPSRERPSTLCSRDQAFVIIDTSCVHCNSSHAPSGRDRSHPNPRRRLPLPPNLQTAAGSVNRNEVFESRLLSRVQLSGLTASRHPVSLVPGREPMAVGAAPPGL